MLALFFFRLTFMTEWVRLCFDLGVKPMSKPISKIDLPHEMTLGEAAEAWWKCQGHLLPERGSEDWQRMYECWIAYAFEGFAELS